MKVETPVAASGSSFNTKLALSDLMRNFPEDSEFRYASAIRAEQLEVAFWRTATGRPNLTKAPTHPARHTPKNSDAVGAAVTARLKAYYDDIARQAVPDRFLNLLAQLDAASDPDGKPPGGGGKPSA